MPQQLMPGSDVLGKGYDIFGHYADARSFTYDLFDFGQTTPQIVDTQHTFLRPQIADFTYVNDWVEDSFRGYSATEYQQDLNLHIETSGSFLAFGGGVQSDLVTTLNKYNYTGYTTVFRQFQWYILKLPVGDLRRYLKPQVKHDIDTMDPSDLFRQYGTHFVSGVAVGANCIQNSSTNVATYKSHIDLKLGAEGRFKVKLLNVQTGGQGSSSTDIEYFMEASHILTHAVGGDPTLSSRINDYAQYTAWTNTMRDAPAFIDFAGDALRPIWELCSDSNLAINWRPQDKIVTGRKIREPRIFNRRFLHNESAGGTRAQLLYNEYLAYCQTKQGRLSGDVPQVVTDIQVLQGKGVATTPGYILCPIDLNRHAGGEYLYLEYKREPMNSGAADRVLRGFDVVSGGDRSVGDDAPSRGWVKYPIDLNEGAGGKYIYFIYTKNAGEPIEALDIQWSTNDNPPAHPPFVAIPKDLNKGAGGNYIWAYYKKVGA